MHGDRQLSVIMYMQMIKQFCLECTLHVSEITTSLKINESGNYSEIQQIQCDRLMHATFSLMKPPSI